MSSRYRLGSLPPLRRSVARDSVARETPRSIRAGSTVPARSFRSSSLAPSMNRIPRAASLMPQSAIGRARVASVLPLSTTTRRNHRASSCAPTLNTSTVKRTSVYDFSELPSRQFGSKLGGGYKPETTVRPAIYDEYYGTTYVPSGGRDSWSAYRISDETLDVNDDLVYQSAKKDQDVMKRVNRQIAEALASQPRKYATAPDFRKFTPQPVSQVAYTPSNSMIERTVEYRRPDVTTVTSGYRTPNPRVKVTFDTVDHGSQLLTPKNRLKKNEYVDLERPALLNNLKSRLSTARDNMALTKKYMSRHAGEDSELAQIDAEVRAIKSARNTRAQAQDVVRIEEERQLSSQRRRRFKETLRKSRYNTTF